MDLNFTSTSFDSDIDEITFRKKVFELVTEILRERFPSDIEKQTPYPREERLNIACPYCGDSAKDSHKKRGNIYYKGYSYHCYNCLTHTTTEDFLKDFGKSLNSAETVFARNIHTDSIVKYAKEDKNLDISYFIKPEILEQYAIPKEIIYKHYGLTDIEDPKNSWIRNYLKQRYQTNNNVFAWDQKKSRLFIFNLTKENKVLGFQVRNFKSEPKYVTHTLEMIYRKLELALPTDEQFKELTRLSFLFGLSTTDFSQMITITEGPLDAFLIRNGMSVCGTGNDFPFEISNIRWMYDFDKDGTAKALEKISQGESVFLWKKYIAAVGLNIYKEKLDYTDAITIAKKSNKNLLSLDGFFSTCKYDSYYI